MYNRYYFMIEKEFLEQILLLVIFLKVLYLKNITNNKNY